LPAISALENTFRLVKLSDKIGEQLTVNLKAEGI
jgi:hypothetical protein